MLLSMLKGIVARRRSAPVGNAQKAEPALERALALQASGRLDDAETEYRALLALDPANADAVHLLGVLLHRCGRSEEALIVLENARALVPGQAEVHLHLAGVHLDAGRYPQAEGAYTEAVRLAPRLLAAHVGLGILFKRTGRLDEASHTFEQALSLDPSRAENWHNLGSVQRDLGDEMAAVASFDRALAVDPEFQEARFSRGLALLALGRFDAGWADYEARAALPRRAGDRRPFDQPRWQGQPLRDRSLLVWGEQGVGDELFHAGMYQELIDAGARCVIECSGKLVPLFARSFAQAVVVPRTQPPHPATLSGIDYQIGSGSLGRFLRPSLDRFPARAAYLLADPAREAYWRGRLAQLGEGLKLGFSWRSSDVSGERALACTTLDQWDDLLRAPNVHWVSLQYDDCRSELSLAVTRAGVVLTRYELDYYDNLDEVSALVRALDLVISAPTAVSVHAAALGVDVWQLTYGADWQTHGTPGAPWYPTLTRFERRWNESWHPVLDRVADRLRARSRERST